MNTPGQKPSKKINRRAFIASTVGASAAFAIVPRHVIGGADFVAPSDKITLGYIGCGTQGMREMAELITNPKVQIVAVCDPNKFSTDYIDWSPNGIRDSIRKTLQDPTWAEAWKGIAGGRDVGQQFIEKYYIKNKPSEKWSGCASFSDFRELLEKQKDMDGVKIMTPDHLHATISIAAMKKGKHVVIHKPIANRMAEVRLTLDAAKKSG